MSVLFAALKLCPEGETKGSIDPLPTLAEAAAQEIFDSIAAVGFWAARRKIPEDLWKALLDNESTRERIWALPS